MKKSTVIVVAIALWIGISSASDTTTRKDLPKEVTLGSLSNIYEPVLFNHSGHVSTAGDASIATTSTARWRFKSVWNAIGSTPPSSKKT